MPSMYSRTVDLIRPFGDLHLHIVDNERGAGWRKNNEYPYFSLSLKLQIFHSYKIGVPESCDLTRKIDEEDCDRGKI